MSGAKASKFSGLRTARSENPAQPAQLYLQRANAVMIEDARSHFSLAELEEAISGKQAGARVCA
ncbi:MAG TPA: hypothetical protein DEA40_14670 [Parvularcula sp.]|nr:hypothetical protein [Parvularcula sp.]